MTRKLSDPDREPTPRELRLIEREWPVIAAELAAVGVECEAAASVVYDLADRRARRDARVRIWSSQVAAPDGAA